MCILLFYLFSKILKNYFFFLVEIDDLKKITNSLTVLCSEKQKQEKVKERVGWEMCVTRILGCRHGIFTKAG